MPIRHGGRMASRACIWPRDHFCRSTMAPRRFWLMMWNEFLPISMPITAGEVSSFCDMACSLSSVPPASVHCWQGGSTAGSDDASQAHSARFLVSTRTHREVLALMDRAEEKAGPEDVGEQALMRGLDTAFPFFRLGLSWSSVGRRSDAQPHNGFQEFPCRGPAFTSARLTSAAIPLDSGCNGGGCGPVERTSRLERSTAPDDVINTL